MAPERAVNAHLGCKVVAKVKSEARAANRPLRNTATLRLLAEEPSLRDCSFGILNVEGSFTQANARIISRRVRDPVGAAPNPPVIAVSGCLSPLQSRSSYLCMLSPCLAVKLSIINRFTSASHSSQPEPHPRAAGIDARGR